MNVYKMLVNSEYGPITSVVLDRDVFDAMIDRLAVVFTEQGRAGIAALKLAKAKGHMPMIGRGTKTQFIFDEFGIDTDRACFIVRGKGDELFKEIISMN